MRMEIKWIFALNMVEDLEQRSERGKDEWYWMFETVSMVVLFL